LEDRCLFDVSLSASANINLSHLLGSQAETTIAIDPTNPNRLFAASVSYPRGNGIFAAISRDGGASWNWLQQGGFIATGKTVGDSLPWGTDDPQVSIDRFGNVFLAYMNWPDLQQGLIINNPGPGGVTFSGNPLGNWSPGMWSGDNVTLTNGGQTQTRTIVRSDGSSFTVGQQFTINPVGAVFTISDPDRAPSIEVVEANSVGGAFHEIGRFRRGLQADYPAIATGPGVGAPGAIWLVWKDGPDRRSANVDTSLYWARADVNGNGRIGTFSLGIDPIPGSLNGRGEEVAIGPRGQALVTWLWGRTPTFSRPDSIYENEFISTGWRYPNAQLITNTNIESSLAIPAQPLGGIWADPGLAWDRSGLVNAGNNGVVYLAYTNAPAVGSFDTDIYCLYSKDSGATWTPITNSGRVNAQSTNSQFMPTIAVDQSTGLAAVAWYDSRDSRTNDGAAIYGTVVAAPGSNGLSSPDRLQTRIGVALSYAGRANARWDFGYGDYIGITFHAGGFNVAWADNSNSTGDNPDGTYYEMDVYAASVSVRPVVAGGPNPLPVAHDATATAHGAAVDIDVAAHDYDADGDTVTVTAVSTPANGTSS
jgi:hypothetical protein